MNIIIDGHTYTVPTDAVRTVHSRFRVDGYQEYTVNPPYGDGTTRHETRALAWASIKEKADERYHVSDNDH